jgi:starvation-inducible DNA-binding protein
MATRDKPHNEAHHKIDIGLKDEQRQGVIEILNKGLSDQHVLYTKTRNYHWNVIGPNFYGIHKLLEEQYTIMAEGIDEIAERVRQLGGRALGTMAEFIENARLTERPEENPNARDMIHNLLHDHEAVVRQLREDITTLQDKLDDQTTADFLTAHAIIHEKMAWMLGSLVADDHSLDAQTGTDGRGTSR